MWCKIGLKETFTVIKTIEHNSKWINSKIFRPLTIKLETNNKLIITSAISIELAVLSNAVRPSNDINSASF